MSPTHTQDLTERVLGIVITKCEAPQDITPDTRFEEMEFDSLILVELAVKLTSTFGVEVDHGELLEAGTVTATVALLAAKGVRL